MNQNYGSGLAGSVIITDGQANQGVEIPISGLGNMKPIHIIGVGNKDPLVDIAILSINAPPVIPEAYSIEEFAAVPQADTAAPAVV